MYSDDHKSDGWCDQFYLQAEDVIGDLLKQYAVEEPSEEKTTETTAVNGKDQVDALGTNTTTNKGKAGNGQGSHDKQEIKPVEKEKRRFTNIVAIVDPPRVGLHHVVSPEKCPTC
jgi:tRNA (uracil-5-)-methyltransferase